MPGDLSVPLSLSTICQGNLEKEFQRLYPELVNSLGEKDKASLNITITLTRVPNTTTMVALDYKLKATFPPIARSSLCAITQGGKLQTDAPPKYQQISMVQGGKE